MIDFEQAPMASPEELAKIDADKKAQYEALVRALMDFPAEPLGMAEGKRAPGGLNFNANIDPNVFVSPPYNATAPFRFFDDVPKMPIGGWKI